MTNRTQPSQTEPAIAVGLIQTAEVVRFRLEGDFRDASGRSFPSGDYTVTSRDGSLCCQGDLLSGAQELSLSPADAAIGRFSLEATIGIDFHWQQREVQTFCGQLRLLPLPEQRVMAINDVALETYLLSVICSEMSAESPPELARAHAVISRSWLLAQLQPRVGKGQAASASVPGQHIRFYDREAHTRFDVCADDHCQRYQGVGRIRPGVVHDALRDTRGQVLSHGGQVCDARFSKCCGGVTEDFRLAWDEVDVPYLVPVVDGPGTLPDPPLTDEGALQRYLGQPPNAYCNCRDEAILGQILNAYDRQTQDFFRWQVRLPAEQAGELIRSKIGLDLGRLLALRPVERGLSGRLKRLELKGERAAVVIGKELEIRRALSPTHLLSSAFQIATEGPAHRPDLFVLTGTGWGHGVGLCQIGAAVMAWKGIGYQAILAHYYPGSTLQRWYG